MYSTIIDKHIDALAIMLIKAKKEKKWRGDGKGNLIENRAVNDAISGYCYINGTAILAEAGLSYMFERDRAKIEALCAAIKTGALAKAKARLWTA